MCNRPPENNFIFILQCRTAIATPSLELPDGCSRGGAGAWAGAEGAEAGAGVAGAGGSGSARKVS